MTLEQWRRYAGIWSLDADRRERELAACVAGDVSYTDPNVSIAGLRAFSDYMAGFQRGFPGHSFHIRAVSAHHACSVARWDQLDAAGAVVAPGISFAESGSDGRIQRVRGFFGDVEAVLR
jgi:predicted ester cyclase